MTYDEGRDEILAVFKTAWGNRAAVYVNLPGKPPPTDAIWARPKVQHYGGGAGAIGGSLWDRTGWVWIQVFAIQGDGNVNGYAACQTLVQAYEDYKGSIWFRRVRMAEAGEDGAYTRFDVRAEFEYNDVR